MMGMLAKRINAQMMPSEKGWVGFRGDCAIVVCMMLWMFGVPGHASRFGGRVRYDSLSTVATHRPDPILVEKCGYFD